VSSPAGRSTLNRHAAGLATIALLVLMATLMAMPIKEESATVDESVFLVAGYSYWHGYGFTLDPEAPPLAKLISAAPLLFMHVTLSPRAQELLDRHDGAALTRRWSGETALVDRHFPVTRDNWYFWPVKDAQLLAQEVVYGGANDADKILAAGRWMQVALTVLTGIVIFCWLRQLAGGMAGALGVALWALNPVTLAYGHLVLTDMGEALLFVLAMWCFAMFLDRPSARRAGLCGLACGGALVMKFSAVVLAPILLVLLALHASRRRDWRSLGKHAGVIALATGATVFLVYAPYWKPAPPLPADAATTIGVPTWFEVLRPVLIPRDFFKGLALVAGHESTGHWAFLCGQWRRSGWWCYFPVTMAVKTPLPLLLVTIIGLVMWLRGLRRFSFQQAIPWLAALIYLLFAMAGTINIGVRHLLPMFALLAVGTASQFSLRNRQIQLCAWLCTSWLLLATWRAHPYFIEYFNEIAGGPSNGYQWLVDSNLDWGQDVKRLKHLLDEEAITNIDLAYFGPRKSIDYHGIAGRRVTPGEAAGLRTGTLAISATELMNPAWDWLRACHEPAARVGYTMFIYRLADADTKERWEQMLRVNPHDAQAHYNLGIILERAGDADGAITHYEPAIQIQPDFAMAHYNLALALQRAGKVADAVDHYEQVARIEPDNANAYIGLGFALVHMDKVEEAIPYFEQALQLEPDFAEAHYNLAVAMMKLGKMSEAAEHFEQALLIEPNNADVYVGLGMALEKAGRVPEAIQYYEQALRLRPGFTAARNAVARLQGSP
jgi:tetratricopeptide (TPR) repeat protein